MVWAPFFHFYQPKNQQDDILDAIVNQSYRRVLSFLEKSRQGKMTLNVNGGTLELLEKKGYQDVIERLIKLAQAGKIEFTGTAVYHAFLPLLPQREIIRQIRLNLDVCKRILGDVYQPRGFFSPELAYDENTARIVARMGFEWIAAEELAVPEPIEYDRIYEVDVSFQGGLGDENFHSAELGSVSSTDRSGRSRSLRSSPAPLTASNSPRDENFVPPPSSGRQLLKIFFRDKRASVLILSGITRSAESLFFELGEQELKKERFLLTVMDFETFGHHRPGLDEVLFELWENKAWEIDLVSHLADRFSKRQKVVPRACTWSNEEQDFWLDQEQTVANKHPFLLWQDPGNPIHRLQWDFAYFVIKAVVSCAGGGDLSDLEPSTRQVEESPARAWQKARRLLDQALASDQFWWASAKPWWSLEMIELGAWQLRRVIETLCSDAGKYAQLKLGSDADRKCEAGEGRLDNEAGSETDGAENPNSQKLSLQSEPNGMRIQPRVSHFTPRADLPKGECSSWLNKAEDYYHRILEIAFEWQRTGEIRRRHREAYGTVKKEPMKKQAPRDWYNLIVLEFEDEMKKAAAKLEFEKAIKWRDAILKLREGLDIYDVLHVVDDLRQVRNLPSLKSFWEHQPEEFSELAKSAFKDYDEGDFKKERNEKIKRIKQREKAFREKKIKFEDESEEFKLD